VLTVWLAAMVNTIRGVMVSTGDRRAKPAVRGLRSSKSRLIAVATVLGLLASGVIVASAESAWAQDYPSWADVANVRNNEAATKAAVAQIQALLDGLKADAARTQADSQAKGNIWAEADTKFQEAASRAQTLQDQANAANVLATASEQRAGQMAAQLMRSGGGDITATLFANTGGAANLLYGLGLSTKISQQANAIYERALQDKNTAQALTDSADVAKAQLGTLKDAAEKAFAVAQTAAKAASVALAAQQEHQALLQAQLVVLQANRKATEADFIAGIKARTGSGASLGAGEISNSGWASPASGYITDGYGWRIAPIEGASSFHRGTDIAAGCGQNIYAASSGFVEYAGWNGSYGNFILIDHGNGVETGYAHVVAGGTLVSNGESVVVGQNIGRIGSTGLSTGCHLHFEVRSGGVATNAVTYLAGQGIRFG
jgi:murein DD-endopeptidase MepM/ murein hydrolase activator NlpD